MKSKLGPQRIMFPLPTVLVVTGNMDVANIVTIAWISMLTGNPPSLGISVGSRGHTAAQIKENKDFSVNLVSSRIMTEADFCGITSGADTDKFSESGLSKMPSELIASPIIKECPVNIECKLNDFHMHGKTYQFVGEILQTHVDEDKLGSYQEPGSLDIMAVDPLIYYSGVREYWKLGEKTGDAYCIGRKLVLE